VFYTMLSRYAEEVRRAVEELGPPAENGQSMTGSIDSHTGVALIQIRVLFWASSPGVCLASYPSPVPCLGAHLTVDNSR